VEFWFLTGHTVERIPNAKPVRKIPLWATYQPLARNARRAAPYTPPLTEIRDDNILCIVACGNTAVPVCWRVGLSAEVSMEEKLNIRCPKAMVKLLEKRVRGKGGFQSLLRVLGSSLHEQRGVTYLVINTPTAERVRRYATKYGEGGWEERLRPIVAALPN